METFNASLENEDDFFDPGEMDRKLMEKRTREAQERAQEKKQQRKEWVMGLFRGKKEKDDEETVTEETLVIQDVMEEEPEDEGSL
mgnify:FL=1